MISQNSKIHRNTFTSGVNKDFNKTLVTGESMVDAANVSLVDNGVFFSVQNIKGTTNVQSIIGVTNTEVLSVINAPFKIGDDENMPCLVVFTATEGGDFTIWAYSIDTDTLYEMYSEPVASDYFTDDRVIDIKGLSESGITSLYFTDNYHEPRKLRCEIPTGYTPNFLTDFDLSLLRKGAIGTVDLGTVTTGGSLFTGSYQFAYQFLTPSQNKYTRWSLFCNPIHVYTGDGKAGVGLSSNKKIILSVEPSEPELDNFTHFRLAILENVYPEGADNTACSVTDIMEISDYLSGSTLVNIEYKSNLQNNLIDLAEIVIDHSPVKKVKTLEIRDNRLIFGNITYKNLEYDNGTPSIASGTILQQQIEPRNEVSMSLYQGHFRDEVYRFAISYFDENGNYSSPVTLDMSGVTNNQSTQTGFKDMKFPARSQVLSGTRFSILNGVNPMSLGLQFVGIDNHPTWAKGFVILRRERLKNVVWQSPVVPMMQVYGIGALQNYPSRGLEQSPREEVDYPDATPMGPSNTFVPMNLFWVKLREIELNKMKSGSGVNRKFEGESTLSIATFATEAPAASANIVFPPQTMYTQNSKYVFNQSHQLQTVDACKLNSRARKFSSESKFGAEITASWSGTFYALRDALYYYDYAHSGAKPALRSGNLTMLGYKDFDNFSEGTTLNGKDIMLYNNLVTGGISWDGVKPPNVLRCGVVDSPEHYPINGDASLSFAAGGTSMEPINNEGIYALTSHGDSSVERPSDYHNTIEIVNCVRGLEDDRYGNEEGGNSDYVWTGTQVTFTDAELPTVESGSPLPKTVDVWGGDCMVTAHIFKVTDTSYNIPNQSKFSSGAGQSHDTVISRWGRAYYDKVSGASADLCLPVGIKNNAVFIQLYLESEFNGDVMDYNSLVLQTNSTYLTNSLYGVSYLNSESSCRVPLNYGYNINLSKRNTDKVFRSIDPNIPVVTRLHSRILYSDVKVYQSQIEGFDIFRVLNFHDLSESNGGITKLQVVGDNFYALQEGSVSHIGIGERTIEAADSSQLAVRSNEFIGTVMPISSTRGCQHLRSVVTDGFSMYFVDNFNKSVNKVSGQELEIISDIGLSTEFRNNFTLKIPEKEIVGVFDPIKKEYLIGRNTGAFCWVFNAGLNLWVSNYTFAENNFLGGAYTDQTLYLVGAGSDNNNISVHSMYTGPNTYLMGEYVVPYIKVVANPDIEAAKVFDDILLNASDRLDTVDILIEREANLGNQTINGIDLDVSSRGEGNFRVKTLRDSSNRRPRGLYAIYTFDWNSSVSSPQVNLTSVLTKFRISENVF